MPALWNTFKSSYRLGCCGLVVLLLGMLGTARVTLAFNPTALTRTSQRERHPSTTTASPIRSLHANWYGRGSDIWPPTNIEYPVRLEDSFPGGLVPPIAFQVLEGGEYVDPVIVAATQRRGLRWISFIALAAFLAFKGAIGPMDIGSLLVWTFYNYLLVQLANSGDGLASLPPSGHVPHMVRNPLQIRPPNQEGQIHWDAWCNFVLPVALLLLGSSLIDPTLAEEWWRVALGRPLLWWMAVQLADDVLESRNALEVVPPIPLPIQYWMRLSSRMCRWGLLTVAVVATQWSSLVTNTGGNTVSLWSYIYGLMPVVHWIVSTSQVFTYWVPVAGMQYMRAYWAAAEAETITIQPTATHHYARAPLLALFKD